MPPMFSSIIPQNLVSISHRPLGQATNFLINPRIFTVMMCILITILWSHSSAGNVTGVFRCQQLLLSIYRRSSTYEHSTYGPSDIWTMRTARPLLDEAASTVVTCYIWSGLQFLRGNLKYVYTFRRGFMLHLLHIYSFRSQCQWLSHVVKFLI